MPHRTMSEMLDAVGEDLLDDFDALTARSPFDISFIRTGDFD